MQVFCGIIRKQKLSGGGFLEGKKASQIKLLVFVEEVVMMVSSIVELTWARLFSEFVLKKNRGGVEKIGGFEANMADLG